MNMRYIALGTLLLSLNGCSDIPAANWYNRANPESLLDVSSEMVNVQLTSQQSLDELSNWMETDQPTRAEIHCAGSDALCSQAEDVFKVYGLEYKVSSADRSDINLIYERITARDCENRYIDDSINPYNFYTPTYGCSIAANMVQMVSDKRQFVNPMLLDYRDAQQLMTAYNIYVAPQPTQQTTQNKDLSVDAISAQ